MWAWTEKASSTYLKLSAIFDVGYRTRSKSELSPYASHASPPETFLVILEISGSPSSSHLLFLPSTILIPDP